MNKISIAFALLCIVGFVLGDDGCKIVVDEKGGKYVYDLSALGEMTVRYHGFMYWIDLCEALTNSQCDDGTAICRTYTNANKDKSDKLFASLGKFSTRSIVATSFDPYEPGTGFVAMFGEGDDCNSDDVHTSAVSVICDATKDDPVITVTNEDDCYNEFAIATKYGCGEPYEGGGSEGSTDPGETAALVILIILLVAIVLYFGLGAVYQKATKDPGTLREYVVHNEFWCSLPSLIGDGCKFILHGCKRGDYLSV